MHVHIDIDRDKILLTIMVEFMVSILLAHLAEGKELGWQQARAEKTK